MEQQHKRSAFSGKIGFVLSAAGASVGLGNIWRFPYLAAKYGGGIFLLVYILLAVTFGYTMIVAETALGRMTHKSPVGAFGAFGKKGGQKFGGWINAVIPILIVPYYSVIGGWVIKYLAEYIRGNGTKLAEDGYFGSFISNGVSTELCFVIFCLLTLAIIYAGVQNGIERVSKMMMPVLVLLSVVIAIYSVTRPGAIAGVKYFLVPNVKNFSWMTVVAAMGQMFYSLSIAMGILITFGSYMKKDTSIEGATRNVEVFDTAIAIMAGLMIIPAVFAFSGGDARFCLNTLEMVVYNSPSELDGIHVSQDILKQCLQKRSLLYDKKGEEHYNIISALHKSVRNSDVQAAVYWLARMLEAGEDPLYIARRLVRMASEDIGMADSRALEICVAAYQACHYLGVPECNVHLTHAAVYLALAPKSNALEVAYNTAKVDALKTLDQPVPLHIRNAPTKLMKDLGYSKGYEYSHDYEYHMTDMQCLPDALVGKEYYVPSDQGSEVKVRNRLAQIKQIKAMVHRNRMMKKK